MPSPIFGSGNVTYKRWPINFGLVFESMLLESKRQLDLTQATTLHRMSLLLLVLFQFSRPRRLRPEMEFYFRFRKSKISAGIKEMVNALYSVANAYLQRPQIFHHRMEYYADCISEKCGRLVNTVWGFIDGTLRRTCRPSYFQKLLYSGHKRAHGIKFQSVVTPDGVFACFFGPINGNRHDSYMLARSELIPKLQAFMPAQNADDAAAGGGNQEHNAVPPAIFSLYGDPAYPQSLYIFGGYRNPAPGSDRARWNTEMHVQGPRGGRVGICKPHFKLGIP